MAKKQVGTRIKKWLEDEKITLNLTTPKGFEFRIDFKLANIPFIISKLSKTEAILVATEVISPKEVVDIFKQVKKELRIELIQSMHRELLKMVQDHKVEGDLRRIIIADSIYSDGLSKQKIFDTIARTRNAYLYLVSVLRQHFAGLTVPQPSTTDLSMYG